MIYILSLMSEEQLKAFLEKVKADTSLQEKLKAAGDANAVAAIAKEAGLIISADDLTKSQSELAAACMLELSDQELEGVAGGCFLFSGTCIVNSNKPGAPVDGSNFCVRP